MITIRDRDFKVILRRPGLRRLEDRSRRVEVERVDIWPGQDGRAQLGVAWADGSSAICDVSSFALCKAWCEERKVFAGKITIHDRRKAA